MMTLSLSVFLGTLSVVRRKPAIKIALCIKVQVIMELSIEERADR